MFYGLMNNIIEPVLKDWTQGFDINVAYSLDFDNRTLKVYTNSPGVLIGVNGNRITNFTEKFNKETNGRIEKINIVEVDGVTSFTKEN